ncbi:MAG: hypothetical protein ACJ8LG_24660, partial [Massilia sp.]
MKISRIASKKSALQRVDVASPCHVPWETMQGDTRVRHCGDCNKHVFNLSAMPEAEAAALVADKEDGDICIRFYRRADGTVMTSDCGAREQAAVPQQSWGRLPGMAGMALAALSAAGCGPRHVPAVAENVVEVDIVYPDRGQWLAGVIVAPYAAPLRRLRSPKSPDVQMVIETPEVPEEAEAAPQAPVLVPETKE